MSKYIWAKLKPATYEALVLFECCFDCCLGRCLCGCGSPFLGSAADSVPFLAYYQHVGIYGLNMCACDLSAKCNKQGKQPPPTNQLRVLVCSNAQVFNVIPSYFVTCIFLFVLMNMLMRVWSYVGSCVCRQRKLGRALVTVSLTSPSCPQFSGRDLISVWVCACVCVSVCRRWVISQTSLFYPSVSLIPAFITSFRCHSVSRCH